MDIHNSNPLHFENKSQTIKNTGMITASLLRLVPGRREDWAIKRRQIEMANEITLTRDNWRDAVLNAINNLPENIQSSIGYKFNGDHTVVIIISGCPISDDDGESYISEIEVKWFERRGDTEAAKEELAGSISPEYAALYERGGKFYEQNNTPIVTVSRSYVENGVYAGKGSTASLAGCVQLSILEEMWDGGGASLVSKDDEGRFFDLEGRQVLDWQGSEDEDDLEEDFDDKEETDVLSKSDAKTLTPEQLSSRFRKAVEEWNEKWKDSEEYPALGFVEGFKDPSSADRHRQSLPKDSQMECGLLEKGEVSFEVMMNSYPDGAGCVVNPVYLCLNFPENLELPIGGPSLLAVLICEIGQCGCSMLALEVKRDPEQEDPQFPDHETTVVIGGVTCCGRMDYLSHGWLEDSLTGLIDSAQIVHALLVEPNEETDPGDEDESDPADDWKNA